jgi:hypothetical protein
MTSAVSFRALFFVIPSESEESSMDASLRLRSVQHDKRGVVPSALFCHSERSFFVIPSESEESRAWMLRFAYAPFSMTSVVSFRALFFVIPSESEESRAWMLRFAQHHRVVMSSTFVVFTQF